MSVQTEEQPDPHRPALRIMLVADTATPSLVRRQFRRWLDALEWPRNHRDDIIMAVDEATSNVVDHAYPGQRAGPSGSLRGGWPGVCAATEMWRSRFGTGEDGGRYPLTPVTAVVAWP